MASVSKGILLNILIIYGKDPNFKGISQIDPGTSVASKKLPFEF